MIDEKLKILILEDVEADADLLERALKKEGFNFEALRVEDRENFTHALSTFKPSIILSDHSLPQFNSMEALQICKSQNLDIPFIIVTGAVSEEFAVSCIKKGADDYILKSNLSRLSVAINVALSQRKNQRKRQEDEEALRNQNEELIKINQELDSFVYSVSHNLRAPLTSVLGLVYVIRLENKKHNNTSSPYLKMIEDSINGLDETIKEILEYSKNARTPLNIEQVDLEKITKAVLKKAKHLDRYSDIKITVSINIDKPFYSDSYRLSLILSSLISNSINYCDETKAKKILVIEARAIENAVQITVEDNGIGIEEQYISLIFNMFYRAHKDSKGAGLGLYIAKETITKLKGTIQVESNIGKKTTFTIIIPNL